MTDRRKPPHETQKQTKNKKCSLRIHGAAALLSKGLHDDLWAQKYDEKCSGSRKRHKNMHAEYTWRLMPGVTLKINQPSENMFQEDKENRSGGRETPLDTQNGLALPSKKHTA
jgi:hypothetical protein